MKKIHNIDLKDNTDEQLQEMSFSLKDEVKNGKTLDSILPFAFALVQEASSRILNMRHFDSQLLGGMALHFGNIAEMKTGEGKTLVSTLPAYLNALSDDKVHIVTVNEYLAQRDYQQLKPLFDFLGISTACITEDMNPLQKKEAYSSDIIYGTNSEFGFDYLRDNMAKTFEDRTQGELGFAIIDEVDSILIDEARTPLIISGPSNHSLNNFYSSNYIISQFKKNTDYEMDEKTLQCYLTETGIEKLEKYYGVKNIYSIENNHLLHYVYQSLKAHAVMKKDKDYIVNGDKIDIIDSFTGRISEGRRFSNGLHQAIEVKEGVPVKKETVTKATITYQNFFRLYKKLSGMTGTAETEKEELLKVYNMQTIVIPTNKPVIRKDLPDLIFPTKEAKIAAIIEKVKELQEKGQPVLLGTASIEESEIFDQAFIEAGIYHDTLNAKNHSLEADIIAEAGQKGKVTVSTNMAGRGTDIKLGEGIEELGGLYVIGTSKNENRRIDNQLRGRSGRQGDPGITQFYISLEDELMVRFGAEKLKKSFSYDEEFNKNGISSRFLTKIFESSQKNLEGMNYDSRKNLLEYDGVLSNIRIVVYKERKEILTSTTLKSEIPIMISNVVKHYYTFYMENKLTKEDTIYNKKALEEMLSNLSDDFNLENHLSDKDKLIEFYTNKITDKFNLIYNSMDVETSNTIIRSVLINKVDIFWESFLEILDTIKQGIHWQSFAHTNPIYTYEMLADEEFNSLRINFDYEVLQILLMQEVFSEIPVDESPIPVVD